ncbi:annexin A7 isoform X2 [Amblyraja radiata]|uniref:annexin A7 isoform X2 n=1 Tax=Amblyraja radiata TaxID=386614 RepID=UPI001403AB9D|nr:annexin A7 isoform X2 [Amblyraja radiata]
MSYPGYPSTGYPAYPQTDGQPAYPQAGGQYPYPGAPGGAYPGSAGGVAYPQGPGGAYPAAGGAAYPQGPGGAYPAAGGVAYPGAAGGAYPAAGGAAYPGAAGGAYPAAGGAAYPAGTGGSYPHAPGGNYPQVPGGGYPQAPAGGYQQPQAGGYPQAQGWPGQGAPGTYPAAPSGGYPTPPGNQPAYGAGGTGYPTYPAGQGGTAPAPAPGGVPGYGTPGYGGPPQPPGQSYGGGVPTSGGYGSGPASQPSMPNIGGLSLGGGMQGTIKPVGNFNAQSDAEILRQAMKGAGTNEQAIIDVVANRSNDQRQKIKLAFKTLYGKDLIKDLKSELTGNMEEIIIALFKPTTFYDAWSLRKAMEGAGTQDRVLIEILCTRNNQQIRDIVTCYKVELERDLEKDLQKDTSGHFKRLLISMSQGNRDEAQTVDMQKAAADAQRLFNAGEGKLGTDESTFNMILATRSFPQLQATVHEYGKMAKRELLKAIDREFSGDVRDGMHAIVQCVANRPTFFAEKLYKAMKGAGTSDSTLIRVIVTRSEIDLVQIKQAFWEKYQKTLRVMVESDTSGDYKRMLLSIIGN